MKPVPLYFRYPREDVVALVPPGASRILDVGCAAGEVGRALKQRQRCEVVGVERDPAAAAQARHHLDAVHEVDLEGEPDALLAAFEAGRFDCVVYADVLEHLRDPWSLLARHRPLLVPGGALVVSVPNVRHYPVVLELLRGRWRYQEEGVLDRTHLRFFTGESAEELVRGAGYRIAEVRRELHASRGAKFANTACLGLLGDFLTRQFLILATAP